MLNNRFGCKIRMKWKWAFSVWEQFLCLDGNITCYANDSLVLYYFFNTCGIRMHTHFFIFLFLKINHAILSIRITYVIACKWNSFGEWKHLSPLNVSLFSQLQFDVFNYHLKQCLIYQWPLALSSSHGLLW